jgi:hypothetical protein
MIFFSRLSSSGSRWRSVLAVPHAQRVEEVPIHDSSGVSRHRPRNAGGTKNVKLFVFEARDQAGVDQRALPYAGGGIDEHNRMAEDGRGGSSTAMLMYSGSGRSI